MDWITRSYFNTLAAPRSAQLDAPAQRQGAAKGAGAPPVFSMTAPAVADTPARAAAPPGPRRADAGSVGTNAAPATGTYAGWAGVVNNTTGLPQLMPGMYLGPGGTIVSLPLSTQAPGANSPFGTDDYGNAFASADQASDWKARVAARDTALAGYTFDAMYAQTRPPISSA